MAKKQLKKSIIGGVGNYDPGFTITPEDNKNIDPGFDIKLTEEEKEKMKNYDKGFYINEEDNSEFKKKYEETRKNTKVGDAIADAFISDNPYMALLDVATMGSIGGLGGKKFIKNFLTKSASGKKLVEKLPFLAKLTEKVASPKNAGFEFAEAQEFNRVLKNEIKASGLVAEGGVAAPNWSKGILMSEKAGAKGITSQIKGMKARGKYLDDIGFDASKMDNRNVVFHNDPRGHGRVVAEVALPGGQTQLMYLSGGTANKAGKGVGGTTEGMWQPFMGYSDEVPTGWVKNKAGEYVATGVKKAKDWHIKSPDYENFYGSKSFSDIAGQLNRIAAEEGWDLSKQVFKSGKKIKKFK